MKRVVVLWTLVAVGAFQAWPQARIDAIVNSASFQPGLPAGGALATAFLSNLTKAKPGLYVASSPIPYELGGFSVVVNGANAPILAVAVTSSAGSINAQVNFQVPLERNASVRTTSPAGYPGALGIAASGEATAEIVGLPSLPEWGGFFGDTNRYAIAQHATDYSLVTLQNPARPGETIIAYATDFYPVWPHPPVGSPVPLQPLFEITSHSLIRGPGCLFLQEYPSLGGVFPGQSIPHTPPIQTPFLGLTPGMVGVEQINFVVPANQPPGDWALFFNIGSCGLLPGQHSARGASSPYVKLPVR